jgi:hypothetical protein
MNPPQSTPKPRYHARNTRFVADHTASVNRADSVNSTERSYRQGPSVVGNGLLNRAKMGSRAGAARGQSYWPYVGSGSI